MEFAEATPWQDINALIDEEVHRLPAPYRTPILLCYYQCKTNAEAAAELGCAEGTVFSRLARARDRLRKQLQRRGLGGLALAAGGLALTLAQQACVASVPPAAQPAQASKAPKTPDPGLTEAQFKKLKPVLDLKNQAWTTIPWKYSLTEARRLAAKTKKPIFMVVNTGNVMGCA